jgi:hypothetical protein
VLSHISMNRVTTRLLIPIQLVSKHVLRHVIEFDDVEIGFGAYIGQGKKCKAYEAIREIVDKSGNQSRTPVAAELQVSSLYARDYAYQS